MKNQAPTNCTVGIDDMALYIPQLYLPIETLAKERNLEYEKLHFGLGLTSMAIPDVHEDAATMAANAVSEIIDRNQIHPDTIGRIYLGTESALDNAKPTATYLLEMLRRKYKGKYGHECFRNCDVVDLTFACVGGVDALHNTLDWVRGNETRQGIVVTSDFAKYELASSGEYTQGAGAIAMLVKHNPRLLTLHDTFGVGTMGVHDFFKPMRRIEKLDLIKEVLNLAGLDEKQAGKILKSLPSSLEVKGLLDENDSYLNLHKETPVFDGPYSNQTYQSRIKEAFLHFRKQAEGKGVVKEHEDLMQRWERLIFHLPYAFHGKRIASEIYMIEQKKQARWQDLQAEVAVEEPMEEYFPDKNSFEKAYNEYLRLITKTKSYKSFVKEKLEKAQRASSEIGNMYACSIFLALMSTLEEDLNEGVELKGKNFGFLGYGSGSKSKVFEGTINAEWKEVVQNFNIKGKLVSRTEIDYPTYESLHRKSLNNSVLPVQNEFALEKIGEEGTNGAR
ncbi:MAG: hydroxymethylglutaryl-CoA synthase [Saprospiraceae bacterium]